MGLKDELAKEAAVRDDQARISEDARVAEALTKFEENKKEWVEMFSQACRAQGLPAPVPIEVPIGGQFGLLSPNLKLSRTSSHPSTCGLPILFQLDDILLRLTDGGPVYVNTGWDNTKLVGGGETGDPNIFMLRARQTEHDAPGFFILLPKRIKSWSIETFFVTTLSGFSREKLATASQVSSGLSAQEMLRSIMLGGQ